MINQINQELIDRIKKSDQEAFKTAFDVCYDSVFKNIFYKTQDYDVSRDIAQETFIKCWDSRSKIDGTKSFYFWLITIASNLTTNYFKREQMRTKHHEVILKEKDAMYESPNEQLEVDQLQKRIDEIVSKYLPQKCQTIFIMSRYEGKNNTEIAEELSISKKTVENQLYEGLKLIRKKLKKTMGGLYFSFVLL